MLVAREFRFGVSVRSVASADLLSQQIRTYESMGYDVVLVPDHLGAAAPFPALVAAAMVTQTMRIGTYVLNAGFYKPALLTRDAVALHDLSEGRLELGLGAGYVKQEFEAAEIPFSSAGERVEYLRHTLAYVKTQAPAIPTLVAGTGDRVLTIAAELAEIVGFTGGGVGDDPLGERVDFVRSAAGERFDSLELNLAITAVPADGSGIPDLTLTRRFTPAATDHQLLAMPSVLTGSVAEMAAGLRDLRDRYGISYFTLQDLHAPHFAGVIDELR